MCLYIDTTKHEPDGTLSTGYKPRIAKRAIPVWKVLYSVNGDLRTPWYHATVRPGMLTPVTMRWNSGIGTVGPGWHSYASLETARPWGKAYRAYIPKGAHYYIGTDGDMVSNCLYLTSESDK